MLVEWPYVLLRRAMSASSPFLVAQSQALSTSSKSISVGWSQLRTVSGIREWASDSRNATAMTQHVVRLALPVALIDADFVKGFLAPGLSEPRERTEVAPSATSQPEVDSSDRSKSLRKSLVSNGNRSAAMQSPVMHVTAETLQSSSVDVGLMPASPALAGSNNDQPPTAELPRANFQAHGRDYRPRAAEPGPNGCIHIEATLTITTPFIPGYDVHVTYTDDALAVNRWIRDNIYCSHLNSEVTMKSSDGIQRSNPTDANDGVGSSGLRIPKPQQIAPPDDLNQRVDGGGGRRPVPGESDSRFDAAQQQHPPSSQVQFLGLDAEWPGLKKEGNQEGPVALIQISTMTHTLIFQNRGCKMPRGTPGCVRRAELASGTRTGRHGSRIPLQLFRLIADPDICFVGVGVHNDLKRLMRDLGLGKLKPSELQQLYSASCSTARVTSAVSSDSASVVDGPVGADAGRFSRRKVPSLPVHIHGMDPAVAPMAPVAATPLPTATDRYVHISDTSVVHRIPPGLGLKEMGKRAMAFAKWAPNQRNWGAPLTVHSIRYATLDAWVSLVLHKVLTAHAARAPSEEEMKRRDARNCMRLVILRTLQYTSARLQDAGASVDTLLTAAADLPTPQLEAERMNLALSRNDNDWFCLLRMRPGVDPATATKTSIAGAALRDAFARAMNIPSVKIAAEQELKWFPPGTLTGTRPDAGDTGTLTPAAATSTAAAKQRRRKTGFQKPTKEQSVMGPGVSMPARRFALDVAEVLGFPAAFDGLEESINANFATGRGSTSRGSKPRDGGPAPAVDVEASATVGLTAASVTAAAATSHQPSQQKDHLQPQRRESFGVRSAQQAKLHFHETIAFRYDSSDARVAVETQARLAQVIKDRARNRRASKQSHTLDSG